MLTLILLAVLPYLAAAQSSSSCGPAPSGSIRPSIASGYTYQVVATGLSDPRGLAFDLNGHLLVVESGRGRISAHRLNTDSNGCVSVTDSTDVTPDGLDLNHGIAVSKDSRTLYASNAGEAYSWEYNPDARTVNNRRTLVQNMTGSDHSTRTLELSRSAPGILIISFGSQSNYDALSVNIDTGSASVKAFNLTDLTSDQPYTYQTDGVLLGWGLRNEVGVAEHPTTGGIWGVENSADQMIRYGVDIHANNPAEELNFLGNISEMVSSDPNIGYQGPNYGYPWCFSAWDTADLPQNSGIEVGNQFAISPVDALGNRNQTDEFCANRTAARLVFQSHMAPLDIKFNNSASEAWIAFHGSWNSPDPVGYKMSYVRFNEQGEPVEPSTSTTAAIDIFANQDNSRCPGDCFRPATMAIDWLGRIFMSSDSSGEIYMVRRVEGSSGTTPGPPSTTGGSGSTPSPTGGVARVVPGWCLVAALSLAAVMAGM